MERRTDVAGTPIFIFNIRETRNISKPDRMSNMLTTPQNSISAEHSPCFSLFYLFCLKSRDHFSTFPAIPGRDAPDYNFTKISFCEKMFRIFCFCGVLFTVHILFVLLTNFGGESIFLLHCFTQMIAFAYLQRE